ncbi:hypothetical protein SKAU_G00095730 [Synaphobranchus kaupii]|uniref:Tc1-like transposase DDE domain-containing protein n=1 Tax=Synaphobranchus kaupii TaxID=118154 RepID=A0A9Q1FXK5_SYNKA|nr:hypothetical protein SKAU_G00095730 [Synaphobranchus kaupii]
MVRANNAIRLREIQSQIIDDNAMFPGNNHVSLSTIDRILKINHVRMKQVYRVPFERNSKKVKELRYQYVQRISELEASPIPQEYIFIDEAGFNFTKRRSRRNIIGHRAIVDVPGQRGGNVTICAAISKWGVLHHHATLGPYNTAHLLTFLETLHNTLTPSDQRKHNGPEQPMYVVVWDNVSFHRTALVRNWFDENQHFSFLHLPPYSPFLNPIEEFFSAWWWKVYDCKPQDRIPLLQAMEEACGDIPAESCQGWLRHARKYFPCCIARENIFCDVDKNLWPDEALRRDPE